MITALSIILYAAALLFAATLGRILGDMAYNPTSEAREKTYYALAFVALFFVTAVIAQVWS